MTNLLVYKEHLKKFYAKYEIYITPAVKLVLALISLISINGSLGYMEKIKNPALVLIAALMCTFLPYNFIIMIAAIFVVAHMYALAIEAAIVTLVLFLLLFLLYFRFSPKDTLVILLVPVCFAVKIPFVIPVAMGLLAGPASVVSVSSGVIVYYLISTIGNNATQLSGLDAESVMGKLKYIIDASLNNKEMLITVIAFSVTVVLVHFIKRMKVNYAWTIAIVSGILTNIVILFVGDLMFDTNISLLSTILGSVVSLGILQIVQFFTFNVDYNRTEYVQFEDDEYYYYVKAIPKNSVSTPEKKVKNIHTSRKPTARTYNGKG